MRSHFGRWGSIVIAAMAIALASASHADAFVYWADTGTDAVDGSIGRANLDGTLVDKVFIPDLGDPCGVAVDSQHIYWGDNETNSIARANLDGTDVDRTFIPNAGGAMNPCGVTVDGSHIWWANIVGGSGQGSVGRANLDGTDAQSRFFDSPGFAANPVSVATSGNLVFWSNPDFNGPGAATPSVARAGIDGTPPPNLNFEPFSLPVFPTFVAADDSHFYVNLTFDLLYGLAVQRFKLDGTSDTPSSYSKISGTGGLALANDQLYFANQNEGTISHANLDGTAPDYAFIRGAGSPFGIAVDGGLPSNDFSVGQLSRNKRKGTAALTVSLPDPGSIELSGKGVRAVTVAVDGTDATLPITASGKQKRKLKKRGKAKLFLSITFTPTGGTANTETTRAKLVRK